MALKVDEKRRVEVAALIMSERGDFDIRSPASSTGAAFKTHNRKVMRISSKVVLGVVEGTSLQPSALV